MFKISREIHAVMTTEPAIKVRNNVKKQDGGHGNDADGPTVFSDELLSAKKIRRMRRSLHTIAKEESVRPGILFSGRSDKNVMIFRVISSVVCRYSMAMQLSAETFGILASYKGYFFLL